MVGRAWLVVSTAILLGAPSARADEEVVELRYRAPPSCPARQAVEDAIRERTPNVRIGAPAHRVFTIAIDAVADEFRGTLSVGDVADRQLSAARCEDLATALALVTALAIDPMAAARPPSPRRAAWSAELDAGAMIEGGVSPDALLAAVVDVRATRARLQLELAVIAGHDAADADDAEAKFTWLAARPGACWLWRPGEITVSGCGHVEVGAVHAAGAMIVNQRDLTRLWLAAGAHGDATYPLGARMFAQLQLGLSVPLVRDRYIFAPDVEIHDTPSVTAWLAVGVGVRFP